MERTQEQTERLVEIGRNTAAKLIESAVTMSATPEQMSNQLFITRVAGVHILATHLYNEVEQLDRTPDEALGDLMHEIQSEFDAMVAEGDVELVTPRSVN